MKVAKLKEEDMPMVLDYSKIKLGIQVTFQDSQNREF